MAVRFAEFTGRTVVQRRSERRWEMRIGRRAITFSQIRLEQVHAQGSGLPVWSPSAAIRSRRPVSAVVAAALALFAGATVIALAVQSWRASARGSYSVSLPVPPARSGLVTTSTSHTHQRPVVSVAVGHSARAVTAAPLIASPPDDVLGPDEPDATAIPAQDRQRARDSALTTGSLQQWAEPGGRYGFVIAGPLEAGTSQQCRQLSILTREAGEADQVNVERSCAPLPH